MTEEQIPETVTEAIEVDGAPDSEIMQRVAEALQSSDDTPAPTIVLAPDASDTPLVTCRR